MSRNDEVAKRRGAKRPATEPCIGKKDRTDLTLFIPFLLAHDYLFDDPTSFMQAFPVFFVI